METESREDPKSVLRDRLAWAPRNFKRRALPYNILSNEVVAEFIAAECQPRRDIDATVNDLSEKYTKTAFVSIDIDN